MEDVPKPWDASWESPGQGDSCGLQNPAVSLKGHFTIKKVHGVVPGRGGRLGLLQGPGRKNLYFQVLDENYMELQRMRTFVNLMPGEQRSCIGCHESRKHTPAVPPMALADGPRPAGPGPPPQPGDRSARAWSIIRWTCSRRSTNTVSAATAAPVPRASWT